MILFLQFWLAGSVFFAWYLHWINIVGHWSNFFWGLLSWVLLSLGLGLFVGATGASYGFLIRKFKINQFWHKVFAFSILWVAFEWLRSIGPWGMPAGLLSLFLVPVPFLLQTLSLIGLWGQELLIVLTLFVVWKLFLDYRSRQFNLNQNLVILFIFLLTIGFDTWSWTRSLPVSESLNVAVIQPNTPQEHKLNVRYFSGIESDLFLKTQKLLSDSKQKVDFVLWPETVIPRLLLNDPSFLKKLDNLKAPVMFGTPHFDSSNKLFNLIVLYDKGKLQIYAKRHLVPFGEYLPLRHMLGWVGDPAFAFLDYSSGDKHQSLIKSQNYPIGTLICFESMFTNLARDQVKRGAQVLVLITNDAWFLKTAGVSQHARHLVLRAIENRRSAIQLGNSGLSYWVNAKGQVQNKLKPYEPGAAIWTVPLTPLK